MTASPMPAGSGVALLAHVPDGQRRDGFSQLELLFKGLDAVSPVSVTELIDLLLKGVMKGASATVPKDILDLDFWTAHDRSVRGGRWHAATTAVTGGVGGIVGLPALAVELPITTGVMFRSIANTARNFGRDLSDPEAFLDCIAVFSYGGGGSVDDAMDSAYLSIRALAATHGADEVYGACRLAATGRHDTTGAVHGSVNRLA